MKKVKGSKSNKRTKVIKAALEVPPVQGDTNFMFANDAARTRKPALTESFRYNNIENGMIPFNGVYSSVSTNSNMDVRDAVVLCQKAYYNVAIFRNTIELMTEFSTGNIYFQGGSRKSREFFTAFWKRIGLNSLQDKFYRELYRSCNTFLYRQDGLVRPEHLMEIKQIFGAEVVDSGNLKQKVSLPLKYSILNPADLQVGGSLSFDSPYYYKVISNYELQRLRKPRTEADKAIFDKLPEQTKKDIKDGMTAVVMPLDMEKTTAIFYKKQDYEPFAVPLGYPVLEDINWKLEMKKIDMQVSKTMQQVILLVTMGESAKDGGGGVNPKHLEAIKTFFETESVARVLVADYTTKAQFVVPSIADFLNPQKYELINKDIKEGLNNLLISDDEKFANATIKIQVFIEKLRQARQLFLDEFLTVETKRIAKMLGFKNYPTPVYEEIDLGNNIEFTKIYTRLMELGILTPSEGMQAIESGRLPTAEESLEAQKEYRKQRDEGYYEPIIGGPATQKELAETKATQTTPKVNAPAGRPTGTGKPKSSNKVGPMGMKGSYSLTNLTKTITASQKLHTAIESYFKKTYKIDKLEESQQEVANILAETIVANESVDNWNKETIEKYYSQPIPEENEINKKIEVIASEHGLTPFMAGLLYHSQNAA